ncbi:MAG: hypothetical protein B6229_02545 [Spirochaetaceae bacterium 4572_7]|nr:MAG: hypothetical protein B6229_02545 [Spirochaetaceae bacterium 4572_7]
MIHAKMYKQAYEHFTIAIDFYPQSDVLQYYKGLSAGLYAKEQDVDSIKNDYLGRAQRAYEHSIEINPSYIKALYALSILYIYELDRPNDGKELLDRLLAISSREFDAMLVRGLLFEKDGEYSAALDLYDKILKLSKKDSQILTADINRDRVLHRITGE